MIAVGTTAAVCGQKEAASGRVVALVAAAGFLGWIAFYGACLFPGLGGQINAGDSIKIQILGHSSILLHGPGYPMVLMLGALLRALALPVEPWKAMTFAVSVIPAAAANTLAFLIVHRLTGSLLFGAAAAVIAGSARLVAIQGTEAEVYALNLALILGVLYLLIRFRQSGHLPWFLGAAALYALSFGNHLMMIMLLPLFVALAILHRREVLRPKPVLLVLAFILVGAAQYLYLAWVAHAPGTEYSEYMRLPPSARELLAYIGGLYFSNLYGSGIGSPKNASELLHTLHGAHPWISLPLVAGGIALFVSGWHRRDASWRAIALAWTVALCYLPFVLWYGAWDIRAFHLPVLVPLLLAATASVAWALRHRPGWAGPVAMLLLTVGVMRAAAVAGELHHRQPRFMDVRAALEEIVPRAPVERPIVAMSYDLRMAALYHELQGELPPAVYRLEWRVWRHLDDQTSIAGVVFPMTGAQFEQLLRQERPEARCETRRLELPEKVRWHVHAFRCHAAPAPHRLPDR
jgi:hypothetical protein